MTRDPKLYYEDIAETFREIEEFMGDLSFDRFIKDTKVIRTVTMDFIVIGEAAKHVSADYEGGTRGFHVKNRWDAQHPNT